MKTLRNAKGDVFILVASVLMIVILIAAGLYITHGISQAAIGSLPRAQCKYTLELKNKWNSQVEDAADSAWRSSWLLRAPGDFFTGGAVTKSMYGTASMVEIKTDACREDIPEECPLTVGEKATADKTAECLYRRAVDTFYTLQAGRYDYRGDTGRAITKNGYWSWDNWLNTGYANSLAKTDFNLLAISTVIEKPGVVALYGNCEDYVNVGDRKVPKRDSIDQCNAVVSSSGSSYCVYQETPTTCKFVFSRVNEETITLTMISRCQDASITRDAKDTAECKCFVDQQKGYSTANGLPNFRIANKDTTNFKNFESTASYNFRVNDDPTFAQFKGCGKPARGNDYYIVDGVGLGGSVDNMEFKVYIDSKTIDNENPPYFNAKLKNPQTVLITPREGEAPEVALPKIRSG